MQPRPWNSEATGAALIAGILGAETEPRDVPGAPSSTHDFNLRLADQTVIALEVTCETRPRHLSMRQAVSKRSWQFELLEHAWLVWVYVSDVKRLYAELPSLLRTLELADIRRAMVRDHQLDPAIATQLARIGLSGAAVIDGHERGAVILNQAASVGSCPGPEIVLPVVEGHAFKDDNLTKLARAEADEKHLLVWVDSDCHEITAAMRLGHLPEREPVLPTSINAVWLAPAFDPPRVVWRYGPSAGWSEHKPVSAGPGAEE